MVLAAISLMFAANTRWESEAATFRVQMQAQSRPITPPIYSARELDGLPLPVQRYFRAVLREGQPMVKRARFTQEGTFLQNLEGQRWEPFDATQLVTTSPPGFDWDARIQMIPGARVHVRDSYSSGVGTLHAAVMGLVTVANIHGGADLAQGELMRYLAEAVWYPTALLPSQGVRWEAIDATSARATLQDGANSVSLEFRFGTDGLVSTVWAKSRTMVSGKEVQQAPWQGKFDAYDWRGGMLVPTIGEVEWQLPQGPVPYWRGRITQIEYAFA
ncbi:MAG: DUF6544 family protein [Usitatibacter sp.]